MKVREIMTPNPATCTPESSLTQVARTMEARNCGAIPVITQGGTGVVGIVTDRDIVIRTLAKAHNPLELTAESSMTAPAATISDDASLDECVQLMERKKIRRVPVVDASGKLVGIVAQVARRRERARGDRALVGPLFALGRGAHGVDRVRRLPFRERQPRGCAELLDRHLLGPVTLLRLSQLDGQLVELVRGAARAGG